MNSQGQYPPPLHNQRKSARQIRHMQAQSITPLLTHYGLSTHGSQPATGERLLSHMGVHV